MPETRTTQPKPSGRVNGFAGFASPRLAALLGSVASRRHLEVRLEDAAGIQRLLQPEPRDPKMVRMHLFINATKPMMLDLLDIVGWGPASLLDRMEESNRRSASGEPTGLRNLKIIEPNGGEHLLTANRCSKQDVPLFVFLILCEEDAVEEEVAASGKPATSP